MRFGSLTLSLSPAPEEDAARIDQQLEQVCDRRSKSPICGCPNPTSTSSRLHLPGEGASRGTRRRIGIQNRKILARAH
jgi:hypothetical protein